MSTKATIVIIEDEKISAASSAAYWNPKATVLSHLTPEGTDCSTSIQTILI